ncbi:MAG: hypothetical protein PGN34_20505 [Methylobacterium frigidaeris]
MMTVNDPRHDESRSDGHSVESVDQVSSIVILGFAVVGAAVAAALGTVLV